MEFNDAQRVEINKIVERRLIRERRLHDKEMRIQREAFERELARLQLELRSERSLIVRVREWLGR